MSTRKYAKDLREKRRKIKQESQDLYDKAVADGRELTDEEFGRHKERVAEAQRLTEQIEAAEAQLELESSIDDVDDGATPDPVEPTGSQEEGGRGTAIAVPEALRHMVPAGYELVPKRRFSLPSRGRWVDVAAEIYPFTTPDEEPRGTRAYNEAFERYAAGLRLTADQDRVLIYGDVIADDDAAGGFVTAPIQMQAELIQELDDVVIMRRLCRTFTIRRATKMGAPARTARASTFAWGGEVTPPTKDTSLKFGGREMEPHQMSGEIDVSRKFLRSAVIPAVQIINRELARDGGELEEDGFLVGTGAGQPLGIFVASPKGVSTSRDVSNGNTTTAMKFDGLKRALMALKAGHRRRSVFLTSRTGVEQLWLEKDGEGRYLWQDSVREGEPNRVLGRPAEESERVPATFTTGQYVAMFFNPEWYWIVDALDLMVQRLVELEARANKDAFIARRSVDGMPVLEEAFSRVKLG